MIISCLFRDLHDIFNLESILNENYQIFFEPDCVQTPARALHMTNFPKAPMNYDLMRSLSTSKDIQPILEIMKNKY